MKIAQERQKVSVYDDESRRYCCGPCLEHAPGKCGINGKSV